MPSDAPTRASSWGTHSFPATVGYSPVGCSPTPPAENASAPGFPADWTVADKTGGGSYGGNNDAGIAWPPGRPPVVLAVMTTKPDQDAPADNPLVARTAGVLAAALS